MNRYYTQQQLRWLKRGAGISLLVIFIGSFLWHWYDTERQARNVAIILTVNTMQSNLNKLHQYWLLNHSPNQAVINKQSILFDHNGWPLIKDHTSLDCMAALKLLYPKQRVFGEKMTISRTLFKQNDAICSYEVNESVRIFIFKNIGLTVSADFLT